MAHLEELQPGAVVRGILPDQQVTVVQVRRYGSDAVELTYTTAVGHLGNELLYRDREPTLEIAITGRLWSFDASGSLFRLAAEAYRIHLAYLFDPLLAVHTSLIDPLPHQITAIYQEMLTRQPLRFLLADDPGAGKTIMAGLLTKELLIRGDVQRCLVVCPGNLVDQWQDELERRFHLPFEIMTNDKVEAARTSNWFRENPLVIGRLDKLSRDDVLQEQLQQLDWDLVVVDEAHKLAASFTGGEVHYTKRYHLGQLLSRHTRHVLLLTATPHNGREEDFQLFMALLDGDRFEGRFRQGVHTSDVSDLMRRLTKERLVTFEGKPLFPERRATTVTYTLSPAEAALYRAVTAYVREEFNRAEALAEHGRKGTVGFALTILQRRLASSPQAIDSSLRRRRERLESRLREEELRQRGASLTLTPPPVPATDFDDLDDAPDAELAAAEEELIDQATAARTIAELRAEVQRLHQLEAQAEQLLASGTDRKWEELRELLHEPAMVDATGQRHKLIIFTEHRDTLSYLTQRLRDHLGNPAAVVAIHGGMLREERRVAQERFTHDRDVQFLVATDAAGEGINLQRAHLMVNYDLPWNPNRLEQRFGRIHRIGQTEVCHLWNLVAKETREGDVYYRLLQKLEQERAALAGQVFDILGRLTFDNRPLRELLIEAIRYGEQPEVRQRLYEVVDHALDTAHLQALLAAHALTPDTMDTTSIRAIRDDMERAEARRLQPHFIAAFFQEAFRLLGGTMYERETGRYEITHVPSPIRQRDRQIGRGSPILSRYERVTFQKARINLPGKPLADFLCPGHPLLDVCIDLLLERHRDLLRQGATLVDETDPGTTPSVLCFLEHTLQDGRSDARGQRHVLSRELQFVAVDDHGQARPAGAAPYLDCRPLTADEASLVAPLRSSQWLTREVEAQALNYAITTLVPQHRGAVRQRVEALVEKTKAAVHARLTREIMYWDHRAVQLKQQEDAGRPVRLPSQQAVQRRTELENRLHQRLAELEQQRQLTTLRPVVIATALIIPAGLLAQYRGARPADSLATAQERERIEQRAMAAVLAAERQQGFTPRDVSDRNAGYDIESHDPVTGRLRFLEVKGLSIDTDHVIVTKNEILTALNKPDDWWLVIVRVDGTCAHPPVYLCRPFQHELDFAATSVTFALAKLLVSR